MHPAFLLDEEAYATHGEVTEVPEVNEDGGGDEGSVRTGLGSPGEGADEGDRGGERRDEGEGGVGENERRGGDANEKGKGKGDVTLR